MAGAFDSAFSSAFDVDAGGTLPTAAQKSSQGGGLMFARKQLQYLALAGPLLIPAVVPDLAVAFSQVPVRRKFDIRHTQSAEFGREDPPPPAVPDLSGAWGELPLRRRPLVGDTRSTNYGQEDVPPPPAPDLVALSAPVVVRRVVTAQGLTHQQVLLPPGYPPDWYPRADYQIRRRRFLTAEGYASPHDKPVIPFNPAQGVAILPQPPLAPHAHAYYAALSTIPPVGPPSPALTPPGVVSWQGLPNQPVRPPAPRQGLWPAPQNVVPIPQPAPPEGSWYPCAILPPTALKRRPQLDAYAFNPEPIDTPALLSSFWTGLYPPGPFAKVGLRTDLQQPFAEAPPIIEIIVVSGAWRPEAPAVLFRAPRRTPEASTSVTPTSVLGDAYGCMTLSSMRVTHPTLLAVSVEYATLTAATVTFPTWLDVEGC